MLENKNRMSLKENVITKKHIRSGNKSHINILSQTDLDLEKPY